MIERLAGRMVHHRAEVPRQRLALVSDIGDRGHFPERGSGCRPDREDAPRYRSVGGSDRATEADIEPKAQPVRPRRAVAKQRLQRRVGQAGALYSGAGAVDDASDR
ncbi:hypothetical protein [Rhodopila sp.]|uniref:hypothetical protein n=1 Tax=Rhodopila sp. TaxID=2480087 RepID=UPI003D0C40BA